MINAPSASILIVDDNTKNLQVLAEILGQYKVATAKEGVKALKFAIRKQPDLILLDIMMPEMDGFELCRRLKKNDKTQMIPVIFISALAEVSDKVKGFEAGGVDYITKPFQKEEVLARVDAHLKLKFSQQELQSTNELLRTANATKDKLLSIISHDLRGPLGILTQTLEMLADQPHLFDEEKQKHLLKDLKKSGKEIYELVEKLLYWARNQRGEIEFKPVPVDIGKTIARTFELLSGIAKDKSIHLDCTVKHPLIVHADPDMLMIILRNLISNALKFTPDFGYVNVVAEKLDQFVQISVSDTGVGISPENIDRLFRLDRHYTTYGTRNEKGSGLGLLMCKEFVEKHGGTIWIESRKNEGTLFKFALPIIKLIDY